MKDLSEEKIRYNLLKDIKDELINLKSSPLYEYRTKNGYFPVIGEGDHFSKILFVGEAPGLNEAKKGRPFCGASGKFLDLLIESIGLTRKDVYITNLVKDRPPENRDPEQIEIDLYSPFLNRQIEIIKPSVVIALGRHSMKYLMELFNLEKDLDSISKIHGKVFKPKSSKLKLSNLPSVICLYHPAVALYNGSMREVLLDDFKIINEFINSNETQLKKPLDKESVVQLKLIK